MKKMIQIHSRHLLGYKYQPRRKKVKDSFQESNSLPCSVEDILAVMKVDNSNHGNQDGNHSNQDGNTSSDTSSLGSSPPSPTTSPHTGTVVFINQSVMMTQPHLAQCYSRRIALILYGVHERKIYIEVQLGVN